MIIGTTKGVLTASSIKRLVKGEARWNVSYVADMKGTPWEPVPGRAGIETKSNITMLPESTEPIVPRPTLEDRQVRRVHIRSEDIRKYGMTPGCAGCIAWRRNGRTQNHTEPRRRRIETRIREDADDISQRADDRITHKHVNKIKEHDEDMMSASKTARTQDPLPSQASSSGSGGLASMEMDQRQEHSTPTPVPQVPAAASPMNVSMLDTYTGISGVTSWMYRQPAVKEERIDASVLDNIAAVAGRMPWHNSDNNDAKTLRYYIDKCKAHIHGSYSPHRVTTMAQNMKLVPGLALDLTTTDENGVAWDFNIKEMIIAAEKRIRENKASLLIVSPMCPVFSTAARPKQSNMTPQERAERIAYGRIHLDFTMYLCRIQHRMGLYYFVEHPRYADSWQEDRVQKTRQYAKGIRTDADMCQIDMRQRDEKGEAHVKKPTQFMTNPEKIARVLNKQCLGYHRHIPLQG